MPIFRFTEGRYFPGNGTTSSAWSENVPAQIGDNLDVDLIANAGDDLFFIGQSMLGFSNNSSNEAYQTWMLGQTFATSTSIARTERREETEGSNNAIGGFNIALHRFTAVAGDHIRGAIKGDGTNTVYARNMIGHIFNLSDLDVDDFRHDLDITNRSGSTFADGASVTTPDTGSHPYMVAWSHQWDSMLLGEDIEVVLTIDGVDRHTLIRETKDTAETIVRGGLMFVDIPGNKVVKVRVKNDGGNCRCTHTELFLYRMDRSVNYGIDSDFASPKTVTSGADIQFNNLFDRQVTRDSDVFFGASQNIQQANSSNAWRGAWGRIKIGSASDGNMNSDGVAGRDYGPGTDKQLKFYTTTLSFVEHTDYDIHHRGDELADWDPTYEIEEYTMGWFSEELIPDDRVYFLKQPTPNPSASGEPSGNVDLSHQGEEGNNKRCLVMVVQAEDSVDISATCSIGGRASTGSWHRYYNGASTGDQHQWVFWWSEADIALMSGSAISWSDDRVMAKVRWYTFVLDNVLQDTLVRDSAYTEEEDSDNTIAVSGVSSAAGDIGMFLYNNSADTRSVSSYSDSYVEEYDEGTDFRKGTAFKENLSAGTTGCTATIDLTSADTRLASLHTFAFDSGLIAVEAGFINTAETLYAPSLALTYYIDPTLITSAEAVHQPDVVASGAVDIDPDFLASVENVFQPGVVATGAVGIAPAFLDTLEALHEPAVVAAGAATLAPAFLGSAEALFEPAVVAVGDRDILPGFIATAEDVFQPAVNATGAVGIEPEFLGTAEAVFAPNLEVLGIQDVTDGTDRLFEIGQAGISITGLGFGT